MTTIDTTAKISVPADEYEALRSSVDEYKAAVEKLQQENARLSDELTLLINRMFRKKSERLDPNQLRLFADELAQLASVEPADDQPAEPAKSQEKRKKGHGRESFPKHLPREEIVLDVPESERICEECGEPLRPIGEDTSERGHVVPARVVVRRYVRKKYACAAGHAVRTAELPPSVIDKGKYEASTYAHLAVAKYGDHLPLHRLEGIYKRHGFRISRSSMWDMIRRIDELVAQPVLKQMRRELLAEPMLHADETPTTVLLEDSKGSKKAYIWCYGVGAKWVFDFTLTRERDGPRRFLGDWDGSLVIDGYSGYDEVIRQNGIVRVGCWAHARRKLKDALDTGATKAVPLLRAVQRLFWIERAVKRRVEHRDLAEIDAGELRGELRSRRSAVTLAKIRRLVDEAASDRSILPKSPLGRALTYLTNQAASLSRFVGDPALPIHNNDAERALRHVVVGRRNWLFFGSPRGARVGANLFSLIATCKALGINPEVYLEDVLSRVDTTPASDIASLTPWAWAGEDVRAEPLEPLS